MIKKINNIKQYHIENVIKSITEIDLIKISSESMDMQTLLDLNVEHRKHVGNNY